MARLDHRSGVPDDYDHRVVTFDARACGASTRRGPYDADTDAGDLLAVAEAAGGHAVALAVGYGFNVAVRVASARREAISDVVCVQPGAAAVLPRSELKGSDGIAASDSVVEMLVKMMSTDPRTAVRTLLAAANPQLDDGQLRDRVARVWAYISPEATQERTQAWLQDDPSEPARILGDRLWILHGGAEPIYEGALAARVAELYPKAHLEEIPGGPISSPDRFAASVRHLTGARTTGG